ncbi:hypothetical protein [Actinoallomurus iriomotensis]|uniref:Uncharacterized protein n=1 Tax=Actinoallomurus iriomotensis TaxID=478107 RepID=A0A9W6W023_9ACTN|nr:hypothetical protein [Actinoallomurus iriomotensis]GLY85929.1 hypothetical protein Airi02_038580 [Actinoallomurus iriomotensis]
MLALLRHVYAAGGAAGVLYALTVAVTAITSVAAPTPRRRKDARTTLRLLLPRGATRRRVTPSR